jgi:hypothetical protein
MYFNVFDAAPENERDGPSQQATQNVGGKVRFHKILDQVAIRSQQISTTLITSLSFLNTSYSSSVARCSSRLLNEFMNLSSYPSP